MRQTEPVLGDGWKRGVAIFLALLLLLPIVLGTIGAFRALR